MTRRARFTVTSEREYDTVENTVKAAITAGIPVERQVIRLHTRIMIDIIYDETQGVFDPLKTLLGQVDRSNLHHHYTFNDHKIIREQDDRQALSDITAHHRYQYAKDDTRVSDLRAAVLAHGLNTDTEEELNAMSAETLREKLTWLRNRQNLINAHRTHNPTVTEEAAKAMSSPELRKNLKRQTAGDLRIG